MPLTITGIVATLVGLILLCRYGLARSILHPFPHVCLQYVLFFGTFSTNEELKHSVDLACLLAFVTFSAALLIGDSLVSNRVARASLANAWPASPLSAIIERMRTKHIAYLVCWIAFVLCIYTFVFSLEFGGLASSLVRFYRGQPNEYSMNPWIRWAGRLLPFMLSSCLCCIAVLRVQYLAHKRCLTKRLSVLGVVFYLLLVIPIGSAGLVFACGMTILLANVAVSVKKHSRVVFRPETFLMLLCAVALAGVLQSIRSVRFDSPRDAYDHVLQSDVTLLQDSSANIVRSHSMLPDWVAICLQKFGTDKQFLWFYTPYTLAVSFIPRQFWPAKPAGFGKILATPTLDPDQATELARKRVGASFAAGLAGEGYANGGYVGVIALSLVLGLSCGIACKYAVVGMLSGNMIHFIIGLYCRQIPPMFVRGDVLSAFGAAVYPLVFMLAVLWVYRHVWPRHRRSQIQYRPFVLAKRHTGSAKNIVCR